MVVESRLGIDGMEGRSKRIPLKLKNFKSFAPIHRPKYTDTGYTVARGNLSVPNR